jgi:hypothetical protein
MFDMTARKQRSRTLESSIREEGGLRVFILFALRLKAVRESNPERWVAYCREQYMESSDVLDKLIGLADEIRAAVAPALLRPPPRSPNNTEGGDDA